MCSKQDRQTPLFFPIKWKHIKARMPFAGLWSISSNLATITRFTMCCCLPDWLQAFCCLFTFCFWIVTSLYKVIKNFHITSTLYSISKGRDRNSKIQIDWLILREWDSLLKTTHYINKLKLTLLLGTKISRLWVQSLAISVIFKLRIAAKKSKRLPQDRLFVICIGHGLLWQDTYKGVDYALTLSESVYCTRVILFFSWLSFDLPKSSLSFN